MQSWRPLWAIDRFSNAGTMPLINPSRIVATVEEFRNISTPCPEVGRLKDNQTNHFKAPTPPHGTTPKEKPFMKQRKPTKSTPSPTMTANADPNVLELKNEKSGKISAISANSATTRKTGILLPATHRDSSPATRETRREGRPAKSSRHLKRPSRAVARPGPLSCARQGALTRRWKSSTSPTGGIVSRTARVSIARWDLKEAAGKALARRTETV
jgi:hypothetical protein